MGKPFLLLLVIFSFYSCTTYSFAIIDSSEKYQKIEILIERGGQKVQIDEDIFELKKSLNSNTKQNDKDPYTEENTKEFYHYNSNELCSIVTFKFEKYIIQGKNSTGSIGEYHIIITNSNMISKTELTNRSFSKNVLESPDYEIRNYYYIEKNDRVKKSMMKSGYELYSNGALLGYLSIWGNPSIYIDEEIIDSKIEIAKLLGFIAYEYTVM